ncbi:MAG TPA: tripartite tricarboxylate transporter substrate binding protein [Burkholderiales bacterium]|nr:tripartite tricarboxylate transporter substrate binding protein [Burkholderiales bacterium]
MFRAGVAAFIMLLAAEAAAQYPSRPIRIIVPQSPGASTDLTARLIGQKLSESFKQPVVVDNRPGAGTTHGTDMVVRATPDGYTLLVVASSISINPSIYKKLPYDTLRDLAPVTQLSAFPNMLVVHPSVPVKTVQDLLALAKAKPGQLNYASAGTGTGTHLSAELFKNMTGADMVHVPYKGGGPAVTALIGGQVQLMFGTTVTLLPHVRAGKLRPVAVTTAKRSPAAPDLPTIAESGVPGFDHGPWNGLFTTARTPAPVIARINGEVVKILLSPEVKGVLNKEGAEPVGNTPEQFASVMRSEIAKWAKVIKVAGIKAD